MAQPSLYGMSREELIEECEHLRRQLGLLVEIGLCMKLWHHGFSAAQAKIVLFLYRSYPRAVPSAALLACADSDGDPTGNVLPVHISRIRKRLSWHAISTTYGMGYALTEQGHALCKDVLEGNGRAA